MHAFSRPQNSIISSILLTLLVLVFSTLASLADTRGIIINQDAQLNINVSVDPSMVSDAKIKRYADKMIIELPHTAFPKGFKPGTLRVDSASRPLVKIGKTDTATTVTIRSTKIFMSIQDLSTLSTITKHPSKAVKETVEKAVTSQQPALQSAQDKINAMNERMAKSTPTTLKKPAKKKSKWVDIPVVKKPPKAQLTTKQPATVPSPKTPKAPSVAPASSIEKTGASPNSKAPLKEIPQNSTSPARVQPLITPGLEEDTTLQKEEASPTPEDEDEIALDNIPEESTANTETELETLTLMALEEDIDLRQFQATSSPDKSNTGLPLETLMKPATPSLFTDGTVTRIIISLIFVLLLIGLFFKLVLPKLLQKYPDFFKNQQKKYEEKLSKKPTIPIVPEKSEPKSVEKQKDLTQPSAPPLPPTLPPSKSLKDNDRTLSPVIPTSLVPPHKEKKKARWKKKIKRRLPSLSLSRKNLSLSKIKVWNPLPSMIGLTHKMSEEYQDYQQQRRTRRYKHYMEQLAQLNPEFNCMASREVKVNHALHLVELWGRHMVVATTPKNISILGVLGESGESLYFEDMSPENAKYLHDLLGEHTLTELFEDIPFKPLPRTPARKQQPLEASSNASTVLYQKYLPQKEEEDKDSKMTTPPEKETQPLAPESQINRQKQQTPSLTGQPLASASQPTVIPDPEQWNQPVFKKLANTPVMQAVSSSTPPSNNPIPKSSSKPPSSGVTLPEAPSLIESAKASAEFQLPTEDAERARQKQAEIRNEVEQFVSKALKPKVPTHPYQTEEVTVLKDYDDEF